MWYKVHGVWKDENDLNVLYEVFCVGFKSGAGFWWADKPSFDFFIKKMSEEGVIKKVREELSVVDFLKSGQRLAAIRFYRDLHQKKGSLVECRDMVDKINNDLFILSKGRYGEEKF